MKTTIIIFAMMLAYSCDNSGNSSETKDSTVIKTNTNTGNVSDGGANDGMGDTTSYQRMNDKVSDTTKK